MKALQKILTASLSVAAFASGIAAAVTTTDYSDQWWVASEPGWGASVQQQSSTLFVDLLVYGSDGKPTWFAASAIHQAGAPEGRAVFAGDLFATTGPRAGATLNPASVALRKVGTLTFDASAPNSATISYTVDGAAVTKSVSRQTWSHENLGGTFDTVWRNNCGPYTTPFDWAVTTTVIRHDADNSVTLSVSCLELCFSKFEHEFRGKYAQSGHLGQIKASLVSPDSGSITIFEIERTTVGFTGRITGDMRIRGETCEIVGGRIGAVLR